MFAITAGKNKREGLPKFVNGAAAGGRAKLFDGNERGGKRKDVCVRREPKVFDAGEKKGERTICPSSNLDQ